MKNVRDILILKALKTACNFLIASASNMNLDSVLVILLARQILLNLKISRQKNTFIPLLTGVHLFTRRLNQHHIAKIFAKLILYANLP